MQPLQICSGPTIRIRQKSWCLPYAGFILNECWHDLDSCSVKKKST